MSMEMTVQPLNLSAVSFNKAEMAAAIAAINDRYKGLVVTDKAEAKKDRAEVNKLLKQIDDVRKQVKRQYEAPLKAFEADVKEVVEPLKRSADLIDEQIKAIEQTERDERRAALEQVWAEDSHDVRLERVWQDKWLNASVSLKKAIDEMRSAGDLADADIAAIRNLHNEHEPALMERYDSGANLADVMTYAVRLQERAQTYAIKTPETPQEVAEQLAEIDPRNEYKALENGVQVTGRPVTHKLVLTCTDGQLDEVCRLLDRLGCFFVVD